MRHAALRLEVFETGNHQDAPCAISRTEAEKLREAAYEQGYAAGWQDALEQMRDEDALRRVAAEEALQAVRFSYAEAHQALSASFLALSEAMLAKVLPSAARAALPGLLAEELAAVIARAIDVQTEIHCAPSVVASLKEVVLDSGHAGMAVVAEPSFSDAQVALRLGIQEREINLDTVLAALAELLGQAGSHVQQECQHG